MRLDQLIPRKLLSFDWQTPVHLPPGQPPAAPKSSQGVLVLGSIPNGAAVAAGGAGAPDALRGALSLWFPYSGIPNAARELTIEIYKTGDTVPAGFVPNPVNAALGQTSVVIAPAATIGDVALAIETAIGQWLGMLGTRWYLEHGAVTFVDPVTHEIIELVTPRGYQSVSLIGHSDCMVPVVATMKEAVVRPILNAGFHPGPWRVTGSAFIGYGVTRGSE